MLPVISLLAFCLTFAVELVVAYEKNLANDGYGERVGGGLMKKERRNSVF